MKWATCFLLIAGATFQSFEVAAQDFAEANEEAQKDTQKFFSYFADWVVLSHIHRSGENAAAIDNIFNTLLKDYAQNPILQEVLASFTDSQMSQYSQEFFRQTGIRIYFVGQLDFSEGDRFEVVLNHLNNSLKAKIEDPSKPYIIVTNSLKGDNVNGYTIKTTVTYSEPVKGAKYKLDRTNDSNPFLASLVTTAGRRNDAGRQIIDAMLAGISTLSERVTENYLPNLLIESRDKLYKDGEEIQSGVLENGTVTLSALNKELEPPNKDVEWLISPQGGQADSATIEGNILTFPIDKAGDYAIKATAGSDEVNVTLRISDSILDLDFKKILEDLLLEILIPLLEEELTRQEELKQKEADSLDLAISSVSDLEKLNYPISEGDGTLVPKTDAPRIYNAAEEQVFNGGTDGPGRKKALDNLRKSKKLKVDLAKVANLIGFVTNVVSGQGEDRDVVLNDMLDNVGTLLGEMTVALLSGDGKEEAKGIITDYLDKNLSRLAGEDVSLSDLQPLAIVPNNTIPDLQGKPYYINPKIPYTQDQFATLEKEITDYQAANPGSFVVVNYSQDIDRASFLARVPKGAPEGYEGQPYKVIHIVNYPGSTLEDRIEDAGGAGGGYEELLDSGDFIEFAGNSNENECRKFIDPSGKIFKLPPTAKALRFFVKEEFSDKDNIASGILASFSIDNKRYSAYRKGREFSGYKTSKTDPPYKQPDCTAEGKIIIGLRVEGDFCKLQKYYVDGYTESGDNFRQTEALVFTESVEFGEKEDVPNCLSSKGAREFLSIARKNNAISDDEAKEIAKIIEESAANYYDAYKREAFAGMSSDDWLWRDLGWGSSKADYESFKKSLIKYNEWLKKIHDRVGGANQSQDSLASFLWWVKDNVLKALPLADRIVALRTLASERMRGNINLLGNNEEYLAIRLISTVPLNDLEDFFGFLVSSKLEVDNNKKALIVALNDEFDDGEYFIGDGNYGRFAYTLIQKFLEKKQDLEATCKQILSNDNIFVWNNQQGENIYRSELNDTDGKITLSLYKEEYLDYHYYAYGGGGPPQPIRTLTGTKKLNPFDPIIVYSEETINELQLTKQNPIVMGPALLLHYIITEDGNKQIRQVIRIVLDGIAVASGVGAIAAGAQGVLLVIAVAELVVSISDLGVTLLEEEIEEMEGGPEFLQTYHKVSLFANLLTLSADGILKIHKLAKADIDILQNLMNKNKAIGETINRLIKNAPDDAAASLLKVKNTLVALGVGFGKFTDDWHAISKVKLNGLGHQLNSVTNVAVVYASYGASYVAKKLKDGVVTTIGSLKGKTNFDDFSTKLPQDVLDRIASLGAQLDLKSYDELVDLAIQIKDVGKLSDIKEVGRLFDDLTNMMEPSFLKAFLDKGIDPKLLRNGLSEILVKAGTGRPQALNKVSGWNKNIINKFLGDVPKYRLADDMDDVEEALTIYRKVWEQPENAWDFIKSIDKDSRLAKWSRGRFFVEVTQRGKDFEQVVGPALRSGKWRDKLKALLKDKYKVDNLDDYELIEQVQLIYKNPPGDYFIADQIFVKYGFDADGDKFIDDLIVIENKLSESTRLTGNQETAKSISEYLVRGSKIPGLPTGSQAIFKDNVIKWFKVHSDGVGKEIKNLTDKF